MSKNVDLIVTRHKGAVEWVSKQLGGVLGDGEVVVGGRRIPIRAEVTADDVRNRVVVGNLPLYLAAEAFAIGAIEFAGQPPRGAEYTAEDMEASGATIRWYRVTPLASPL